MSTETPMQYTNAILELAQRYKIAVANAHQNLGLSQEGISSLAIHGAILEEFNDRHETDVNFIIQRLADYTSATLYSTHQGIVDDFNIVKNSPESYNKLQYPVLLDIGVGNIKLTTAIELLQRYNQRNPSSDPLGVKQYNNDYLKLRNDLDTMDHSATPKFAGLMVKQGVEFFKTRAANWNSLSGAQKEALLVFYYNIGEKAALDKYNAAVKSQGSWNPNPNQTPIAQEFLMNRNAIEANKDANEHNLFVKHAQQRIAATHCFAAGTMIATPDGEMPIEQIQVGDYVLAFDAHNPSLDSELLPAKVVRLFTHDDRELYDLDGVNVTEDHRFFTAGGSFISIKDCRNLQLVRMDGALVDAPALQKIDGLHTVYNFEVEHYHTYIADGYRVHNDCWVEGDIPNKIYYNTKGQLVTEGYNDLNNARIKITENVNVNRDPIVVHREETYGKPDGSTFQLTLKHSEFDANNRPTDFPEMSLKLPSAAMVATQIASTFGVMRY